jgi:hypothetical protein
VGATGTERIDLAACRARGTHVCNVCWPKGRSLAAYGSWRTQAAREFEHAYIVEGETDAWTIWHHGLPCLGLPGTGFPRCFIPS